MKRTGQDHSEKAFTRTELCVILGLLAIMTAIALPSLASTSNASIRAGCFNNLRQIGQAFLTWAADHNGENPAVTPQDQGGLYKHPLAGQLFFQFSAISNQVKYPQLFVCPADSNRRTAENWGVGARGFNNVTYRNNAISYFLGVHTKAGLPDSLLSGDHNFVMSSPSACEIGVNMYGLSLAEINYTSWTNNLHGLSGNLLLNDGRVLQVGNTGLKTTLTNATIPSGGLHFASPPKM